jgi:hypothetical protein
MGSPISGLMAEIFLQNYEQHVIKNALDSNKITFYIIYVDDILLIFGNKHTNANDISNYMNKVHQDLHFKATDEIENTINLLDLLITRNQNKLIIDIYRKPTTTDTTIHYKLNHPLKHKMSAYRYLLNRLHQRPLSPKQKHQEMNTIIQKAKHNGYPISIIDRLNKQIINKNNNKTPNTQTQHKNQKWVTFEYHNPIIRKVTNIFRNTKLNITYRVSNTTQNLLKTHIRNNDKHTNSGIYSIKCNTCNKRYIGQTGPA